MTIKQWVASSILVMSTAMGVQAHEAGDIIVRVGATTVEPNDSATTPRLNGAALYGGSVGISTDTSLGLTVAYMLTDNIGLELLAAVPFKHTIPGNDAMPNYVATKDLGHFNLLPPTVTAQYYFNNSSIFTPYVGLGVNYTWFYDEAAGHDLNQVLGGDVDMRLSESWGLAGQIGMDVDLGNNWLLNAAIWYIDIDTHAEYTVKTGPLTGARVKSDVNVDPWVYMAAVGYKF
jgi:outer membrane protein